MSYYMSTKLGGSDFDAALEQVKEALKTEGFGVLTEIDVQATLKKKLDAEVQPYRILGACNPPFAYKALQAENMIGVFLPCNVVVQQHEDGTIEVSAVDPIASMQAVENDSLGGLATQIKQKLQKVIDSL